MFIVVTGFIGLNILNPLKCVSMSNKEFKVRPVIMNNNSDKPSFYPYSILVNKSSGSCNNSNNPCAKLCVQYVFKNKNIKVFNLMPITKKTSHISWHEICICKCRLDACVCNDKQSWNNDKWRSEC